MTQVTYSPFSIEGWLAHILNYLEDGELPNKRLVCKFWSKVAQNVHQTNNKTMFDRIVHTMQSDELTAKTDMEDIDKLEKCACKIINKLFLGQDKEIDLLNSSRNPEQVKVEPLQKKEANRARFDNFFVNRQNIRDYNLGIALYLTGQFKRNDRSDLLELAKASRQIINIIDPTFKSCSAPTTRSPNMFDLSLIGFRDCGLTEFSPEICHLHKDREKPLVQLILEKNRLSYLPREIEDLADLTILKLSDNAFRLFPKSILTLKKLEDLDLANNPLTRIPPEISQLQTLKRLNLQNCTAITSLPHELAFLPELNTINISGTCIRSFPKEIMFCQNQALVNAMVPHLFAELIVKLCEKNNEGLFTLIKLLPSEVQQRIRDHVCEFVSLEYFLEALKDGGCVNPVSLLNGFIKTLLNFAFTAALNPNQNHGSHRAPFWELFIHLQNRFASWTSERFENARIKFLENPMVLDYPVVHSILSGQTSEFGQVFQFSDEDCLKAIRGLFHAL